MRRRQPETTSPARGDTGPAEGLLLFHLGRLLLAKADDLADDLHIEAGGFRLGIDVLDVFAERLALFFKPLDALHDGAQAIGGDAAHVRIGGFGLAGTARLGFVIGIGHWVSRNFDGRSWEARR